MDYSPKDPWYLSLWTAVLTGSSLFLQHSHHFATWVCLLSYAFLPVASVHLWLLANVRSRGSEDLAWVFPITPSPSSKHQCLWKPALTPALSWRAVLTPGQLFGSYSLQFTPSHSYYLPTTPRLSFSDFLLGLSTSTGMRGICQRGLVTKTSPSCLHGALDQFSWLVVFWSSSVLLGPRSSLITPLPFVLTYSDSSLSSCPVSYSAHDLKAVFTWLHTSHQRLRGYEDKVKDGAWRRTWETSPRPSSRAIHYRRD